MPRAQNAFERFRLLRAFRGGAAPQVIAPKPVPVGNYVTWDASGEEGDGPHYTITDDDERITWDDLGE